jgi:hypothetical protein
MNVQRAVCPRCRQAIPLEDINVASDVALCHNCGVTHRFSALVSAAEDDEDLSQAPAGTWRRHERDAVIIGASHRSPGVARALLLGALLWNGVVSVFVGLATISTLRHLGVALPAWLQDEAASNMSVGKTIFLWVFLLPFIAVGLFLAGSFLSCLAGRTEIKIEHGQGTVFAGAGSLGWRRRFATADVQDVRIEERTWRGRRGSLQRQTTIAITTKGKTIRLASLLTEQRLRFMAAALRKELLRR